MCGVKELHWGGSTTDKGCSVQVAQRFGKEGRGICALGHGSDPFTEDDPAFDFRGCGIRIGGDRRDND